MRPDTPLVIASYHGLVISHFYLVMSKYLFPQDYYDNPVFAEISAVLFKQAYHHAYTSEADLDLLHALLKHALNFLRIFDCNLNLMALKYSSRLALACYAQSHNAHYRELAEQLQRLFEYTSLSYQQSNEIEDEFIVSRQILTGDDEQGMALRIF